MASQTGRTDGTFLKSTTDWIETKARKQEDKKVAQGEKMKEVCTFKPDINKMSRKMMRDIGKKGRIQNVEVVNPGNFENRSEFY